NLNTVEVVQSVFENKHSGYQVYNARNGNNIQVKDDKGMITSKQKQPFATYSAAAAYDKKHNRLYYTPMFINELRYIELDAKLGRIYYFDNEKFSNAENMTQEANQITRMVIGADGHGYALTNH